MAGSSLFALLDDIATMLDDVAVAAKKTAGVLGDDLALNANQVSGVSADRELPVVWAVAKGSLVNKVVLVPAALLISAFLPIAIIPLLMLGGLYLCYEGVEKLAHKFFHRAQDDAHQAKLHAAATDVTIDLVALERDKIKGAIRTDFILSAEIIAIALGVVASRSLATQAGVLTLVALLITVAVYGLVAGIVKLDDAGLRLRTRGRTSLVRGLGRMLLAGAPVLMKLLSIAGTIAMFLVGGGILVHGIPALHHRIVALTSDRGAFIEIVGPTISDGLVGVVAGIAALLVVTAGTAVVRRVRGA